MNKKKIEVVLLGGTIACTIKKNCKSETIDLSDAIYSLFEYDDTIEIITNPFGFYKGYEMKISDIITVSIELKRIIRDDHVDGIVVVTGTNVMEEMAFALNLLVQTEIPIVVTGAMHLPNTPGADGPGNLYSSIQVASSEQVNNLGVIVVFNDTIHSADYVRKEHTLNTNAITSDFPLGFVAEGNVSLRVRPIRRYMPWIDPSNEEKDVLLYTSYLGDSGKILDYVYELGYDGVIIEGTGGGNLAEWVFDKVENLHKYMYIGIASRTGSGDVMTCSYGSGYGRPQYMKENGYLISGQLDGRKARILLILLLMSNCNREEIYKSFSLYSKENKEMNHNLST